MFQTTNQMVFPWGRNRMLLAWRRVISKWRVSYSRYNFNPSIVDIPMFKSPMAGFEYGNTILGLHIGFVVYGHPSENCNPRFDAHHADESTLTTAPGTGGGNR